MNNYIDSTLENSPLRGVRANDVGNDVVQEDPRLTEFKNKLNEVSHNAVYNPEGNFADALTNGNSQQLDLRTDGLMADFGQSKYDLEDGGVMFNPTTEKIQNQRFDNQWGVTQLGLGLTKGVITAGTTFLDGISMLTFGVAKGLSNLADDDKNTGFIDGLWNNELTKAIQSVNDWSEDTFKNYYSTSQQNSPWYSMDNLLSANFIGDKILKNMGFMVGAFYSGNVLTSPKLLPKFLAGLTKTAGGTSRTAYKVAKSASAITGSMVSAITEGGIEAVNNSKDWARVQKERLNLKTQEQLEDLNRIRPYLAEEDYNAKLQEIQDANNKALEQIEIDKVRMGNLDMLLNIPILTAENLFAWGRLYSSGFKNATRFAGKGISRTPVAEGETATIEGLINGLSNKVKYPTLTGLRKGATRSLAEGNEEMAQAWASEYAGLREQQDVDNYYKAALNNEAYERTYESWKAASEAWKNTYGNSDQWEEFAIGAISSVFGMPKVRGYRNETTGKLQSPVTFEGGIRQDIAEAKEERAKAQNVIDYLNSRLSDPKFIKQFEGMTAHTYWQNAMDRAAEIGNKKAYKDAETNQFVTDLINLHQAGLLEGAEEILKVAGDVSDISTEEGQANLELIKANDIVRDENDKPVASQRGWFSVSDGVIQPTKDDKEIAKEVTERKDKLLKYIDKYKKTLEELDYDSGGVFSDDQLKELAYLNLKKYSALERMGDILQKLKDGSDKNNIGSVDGFARIINNDIKALEKKENLTEEESKQLVILQDFASAMQQFKNADFSNFDEEKYADNVATIASIIGIINNKNSDGSEASKKAIESIDDIIKLKNDASQFNQRYYEYMNNPGLVEAQIEQLREEKRKAQVEQRTKEIEETLANASDIYEFKKMYTELVEPMANFSDDEEYQRNYKEVLEALRKSTNPVLKAQFKKLDDYARLKGDPNNNKEGYVTQALNKVLQDDDNFRFVSKKADSSKSGKSDKDILIDEFRILNENLPDYFSVDEFSKVAENFTNQLQEGHLAKGEKNQAANVRKIFNKWLEEVKNLEKEYQASLEKEKPKGDTKTSSSKGKSFFDKSSETDIDDGVNEGDKSDEKKGSSDNDENDSTPPVQPLKKGKHGLTNKKHIAEANEKIKEFTSKKYELNRILRDIKNSDDKDSASVTFDNAVEELKKLRDEIYEILTSEDDNEEADSIVEAFDEFISKKENEKEELLKETDEEVDDDLLSVLKDKSSKELEDIINGKETLGITDKNDLKTLKSLAKEIIDELNAPTVQTSDEEEDDDDREKEGIENIESDRTVFGNGTSYPKNWTYTKYDFNELNKDERRKVLYSKKDSTYNLMNNCGAFDFIDRGNLADLCKDYARAHKGEQLPIHFVLSDKYKVNDHHDVILAIEVTEEVNKLVSDRTGKKLPTNIIKYNGKSYYPIGQVSGYINNTDSKNAAANIRSKVYKDLENSKKKLENGVFVSSKITEIENFYSGRLFLTDDKQYKEVKDRSFNELDSAFNADNVILGVYTLAGLKVPRLSANAEIEEPNIYNSTDRSGSVWYMLKGANGIYYPMGVRVGRFDDAFDWRKQKRNGKFIPIVQKLYDLATIICNENASIVDRAKAKFELEDYLSFPSKGSSVKNPIVFGKDEETGMDLVSINAEGQLHNLNNIQEKNGSSRVENFLDALASCNFRFQVKARLLNNKEYLKTLIDSNILTTTLISDHNVCGSFEIKPLADDGSVKDKGLNPTKQTNSKKDKGVYGSSNTSRYIYFNNKKSEFVFDLDGKCEGYKTDSPELGSVGSSAPLIEIAYQISNGAVDENFGYFRTDKNIDVYIVGVNEKNNPIFITKYKNDIKILTSSSTKDYKELNKKYSEATQSEAKEETEKKAIAKVLVSTKKTNISKNKKGEPETPDFNLTEALDALQDAYNGGSFDEYENEEQSDAENSDVNLAELLDKAQDAYNDSYQTNDDSNSKGNIETATRKVQKYQGKSIRNKSETLETDAVVDKNQRKHLKNKDEECHGGSSPNSNSPGGKRRGGNRSKFESDDPNS